MYRLDEVTQYIKENIKGFYEYERIEPLYRMISNPQERVNSNDKKWIAYETQASEDNTVVEAMKEILEYKDFRWIIEKDKVIETVNRVGDMFSDL